MRECCKQPANLSTIIRQGDKITRICAVCGAKHIELAVDPGHIGVKF